MVTTQLLASRLEEIADLTGCRTKPNSVAKLSTGTDHLIPAPSLCYAVLISRKPALVT